MSRIDGKLSVGPAGVLGAGSECPVEFVDVDGGVSVCSTGIAANTEAYTLGFLKLSNGGWIKAGAAAFQVPDKSPTSAYGSWNVHCTQIVETSPGVYTHRDFLGYAFWAGHGAALFPPGMEPQHAPGDKVFRNYGDFKTEKFGCNGREPQPAVQADGTLQTIQAALIACGIMNA